MSQATVPQPMNGRFGALPKVSIVTPSFNQGQFIASTICSVLAQTYPHVEYIIMDSMSTDCTNHLLDKYEGQAHIVREKDSGQADAIDKGFRLATGELLAWLNADDCFAGPEVVAHAVQHFLDNHDVDVLYGRRIFIGEDGRHLLARRYRPHDDEILKKSCFIPQECCFWTREIFDRAGGCIDTSYQFAMDYELWHRFMSVKAKFSAVDRHYGLFRCHDEQKSFTRWHDVGISEVRRIHGRFLGFEVAYDDMVAQHWKYLLGFDLRIHPHQASLLEDITRQYNQWKTRSLGDRPIDEWSKPLHTSYEIGPNA